MQRELCIWKRQAGEAQKKVTQLESAARAKDAKHLEEIEELRVIARNEHESLKTMIQTLEQQLQQQNDHTDRFIVDWPNREDEWRHTCQEIRHLETSGKSKINTGNSTFDFWQTDSGKLHKKLKKWLTRQKD